MNVAEKRGIRMDTEERFCKKCNWNDSDYGCTCPTQEQVSVPNIH